MFNWYEIVARGKRAGYSHVVISKDESNGNIEVEKELVFRANYIIWKFSYEVRGKTILDKNNNLVSYTNHVKSDEREMISSGKVVGSVLEIKEQPYGPTGNTYEFTVNTDMFDYTSDALDLLVCRPGFLEEGVDKYLRLFDPDSLIIQIGKVKSKGKRNVNIDREQVRVTVVEKWFEKSISTIWIDEEGRVVKQIYGSYETILCEKEDIGKM